MVPHRLLASVRLLHQTRRCLSIFKTNPGFRSATSLTFYSAAVPSNCAVCLLSTLRLKHPRPVRERRSASQFIRLADGKRGWSEVGLWEGSQCLKQPSQALIAAAKADTFSILTFESGLFAWMALTYFVFFPAPRLKPAEATYWFMMQAGMGIGFFTSYPMNRLLMTWGIKEVMG